MSQIIRKHYRFYGDVQGVGFRYRAYYSAQKHNIGGWVRNCSDGSVEMEAEGTLENISDLLDDIENGRFVQIERCIARDMPVCGAQTFFIK